ncbi:MAG TPA: GYD domain-containing protein [Solirubrobacteraceae bacterium]|nr:GYD domain-containing protein [Solirubrobacteraceae bacterium]
MPKYLWTVSYTKTGVRGLADEGASSRRDAVKNALEGLGGTLESMYYAFGGADVYAIGDLPDNESAAALSLAANVSEGLSVQTVVLMTPEEFDAATKKTVSFRPPGQ